MKRARQSKAQVLVFTVGDQSYALPLQSVREVVPYAKLVALPDSPPSLIGGLRLRGTLVPVVDLERRLGRAPTIPELHHRIVIVESNRVPIGLLVHSVDDIVSLDDPDVIGHQAELPRPPFSVVSVGTRAVTLMDVALAIPADVFRFVEASPTTSIVALPMPSNPLRRQDDPQSGGGA